MPSKKHYLLAACAAVAAGSGIYYSSLSSGGPEPAVPAMQAGGEKTPSRGVLAGLPHVLRPIVSSSAEMDERVAAVRALPDRLTSEEIEALYALMRQGVPAGVDEGTWYVTVNEVMEVVRRRGIGSDDLFAGSFSAMCTDLSLDPVVRDYAVQHYALWLAEAAPGERNKGQSEQVVDTLLAAVSEPRNDGESILGTSLLALADLNSNPDCAPYLDKERLSAVVAPVLDGSRPASLPNQMASVQAAARLGLEELRPAVRGFASSEKTDPSLRLCSVSALGYYGADEDRALLEGLASGDTKLRFAARAALDRMQK